MRRRAGILIAAFAVLALFAGPAQARDAEPKIIGGAAVNIQQVPWQVALEVAPNGSNGNGYDRQFCGGTLVSPTLVVSAAHCVFNTTGPSGTCLPTDGFNTPASTRSVLVGRTVLSNSAEGAEIPLKEIYYFEAGGPNGLGIATPQSTGDKQGLYDCNTSAWDVVLLELTSPAPPPAEPIDIAGPGEESVWAPGTTAIASGWGNLCHGPTERLPRPALRSRDPQPRRQLLRLADQLRPRLPAGDDAVRW